MILKNMKKQSLLFCSIVFIAVIAFSSASCDEKENAGGMTITSNRTGTYNGYDYELWTDNEAKGEMTVGEAGTFSCSWKSTVTGRGNFLARSGKKFNSSKLHSQVGNISVNYNAAAYAPAGNGVSYLCVYGWTRAGNGAPLVEYYIVDNWGQYNRPPGQWTGAASKGTIEVDGVTYDIYETTRTNMPSIEGTKTFQQYWSVCQTRRTGGTISVSQHFKKWESLGMKLGNLYEVALCVEGYNSSGSAEITENTFLIE
jgi:endo-1,4-beta-xylanase